ncbi:hypothetical protein MFLO_16100 [Listeria floridensis FSL S10-1187]|uniref:DUF3168 domain-containing protein n=1 Tax=Listeria floridensis FSL S10-1187 TaxID=1265817 RepID=A0ABP3AWE5_9LIST|nr:hypothetical protein [Listeria floridensis]EUJ23258.1 hypothetical protein MFLO_16100 [Listeria floridensis FSL S10-1187]
MALSNQIIIRDFIEKLLQVEVLNLYDGLELTPKMKPLIIVQSLNDALVYGSKTKLKDSVQQSELYQIILYPLTSRQQKEWSESIKDALIFHEFEEFEVEDSISVQEVYAETASDELNKHRAFISVTLLNRKSRRN